MTHHLTLSPTHRILLVAGPALLAVGTAITPSTETDAASYLATLAESPGRVQTGAVLFLLGHLALLVPMLALGRTGLGRVARGAATAAAVGAAVFAGLGLVRLFETAVATTLPPETGAEVLHTFNESPFGGVVILPALAALMVGTVVLVVRLWREGRTSGLLVPLAVVGFAGVMAGGDGTPLGVAGSLALTGLFVAVATRADGVPVQEAAPVTV